MGSLQNQRGFTVFESIVAIIFVCALGTIVFTQKTNADATRRDTQRKVAINAMHHSLEEMYYPAHAGYPEKLDASLLQGIDPNLLKDPSGVPIGQQPSEYRYEPHTCSNGLCRSYTLRANLEKEADFVKNSQRS